MKKKISILIGITLSSALCAEYKSYIVRRGDTLSYILYKNKEKKIYGSNGVLKKTIALNSVLRKSRGNKIYPGMKLTLIDHADKTITNQVAEQKLETVPAIEVVEEKRAPSSNFIQSFYWNVSPLVSWKNLSSEDGNYNLQSDIEAASNTSYGINAVYGMNFAANLKIFSELSIDRTTFESDSSINMLKKDFTLSRLALGASVKSFDFTMGMTDQLFLTSPSFQSVEIKKIALPEMKAAYHNDFYQLDNGTLGYIFNGKMLLPRQAAGIDSKAGYGFGAEVNAKLFNQGFSLGYDRNYLKASSNKTTYENIYWKYTWFSL